MGHFGMGAAAADFDGDGWQDLYVTNYGRNVLFRNNGDGTFTNVTDKAGVERPTGPRARSGSTTTEMESLTCLSRVSSSTARRGTISCGDNRVGRRYYCVPRVFKPRPSFLFHNDGGGRFTDVSKESGIANSLGKSFGAVATDVNGDGLIDLFVANDTVANFLLSIKARAGLKRLGLLPV
jgi:hypothetical protein